MYEIIFTVKAKRKDKYFSFYDQKIVCLMYEQESVRIILSVFFF